VGTSLIHIFYKRTGRRTRLTGAFRYLYDRAQEDICTFWQQQVTDILMRDDWHSTSNQIRYSMTKA